MARGSPGKRATMPWACLLYTSGGIRLHDQAGQQKALVLIRKKAAGNALCHRSHSLSLIHISSPEAMALAVGVSVFIGLAFGWYPSWKASKMDPIDALRHE